MTRTRPIARLKVTLRDVEPKVVRRLDVPLKIRLDRLHLVLQAAMGWTNSHLFAFTAGGASWGLPDPDFDDDTSPASEATLFDLVEHTGVQTFHYLYDFGDDWNHVVRLERVFDADPRERYPLLVMAEGRCPPEDVGGPPGYAEFLQTIADPDHEEHQTLLTWCGGTFDPEDPGLERILDDLDRLARRWAPRPRKPKTPPRA